MCYYGPSVKLRLTVFVFSFKDAAHDCGNFESEAVMSKDMELQLKGYGVTTAHILYRMPDHPAILQTYVWQQLLTLFIVYYGAQILIQSAFAALGYDERIEINAFFAGMVALSVVFSSYCSEVLLSAFKAIPYGQYEAGDALGLRRAHTMGLVILPQLVRIALPGLGNLWMNLLKDTALVSIIGLSDILRQTGVAAKVSKEAFFFYVLACILFLLLAIISSYGLRHIEKWAYRSEKRR